MRIACCRTVVHHFALAERAVGIVEELILAAVIAVQLVEASSICSESPSQNLDGMQAGFVGRLQILRTYEVEHSA